LEHDGFSQAKTMIYQMSTLGAALKKYALMTVIGIGVGFYISSCVGKSKESPRRHNDSHMSDEESRYESQPLTREEVFDKYTGALPSLSTRNSARNQATQNSSIEDRVYDDDADERR